MQRQPLNPLHQRKKVYSSSEMQTPLHNLLSRTPRPTLEEIKHFFELFDKSSLQLMARTMNNRGALPIHMLPGLFLPPREFEELEWLLLRYTMLENYKEIHDPIDVKKVLNEYKSNNSELNENLKLACKAANQARSYFNISSTHPSLNHAAIEERLERHSLVEAGRSTFTERVRPFLTKTRIQFDQQKKPSDIKKILLENEKRNRLEQMSLIIAHHKAMKTGNCLEFSQAAFFHLCSTAKEKNAEIWEVSNGDHAFVILDISSPNAVICDPFAGEVFPVFDLTRKLNIYIRYHIKDHYYTLYIRFNPNLHLITKDTSLTDESKIDSGIEKYQMKSVYPLIEYKEVNKTCIKEDGEPSVSPLSYCIKKQMNISIITRFLEIKADPNLKNYNQTTPLLLAVSNRNYDAVKLLLRYKANIETPDHLGETPLNLAVSTSQRTIVDLLLKNKANPNHGKIDGQTPIFFIRDREITNSLLVAKANINHKDINKQTPLTNFITQNNSTSVRTLLTFKANPNETGIDDLLPLQIATKLGHSDQFSLLLNYNADPFFKHRQLLAGTAIEYKPSSQQKAFTK